MNKQQYLDFIAQGRLEEGIKMFLSSENGPSRDEVLLLSGRLANLDRQKNLLGMRFEDYSMAKSPISNSFMEIINQHFKGAISPSLSVNETQTMTNPLVAFNKLYRDSIHADLDGLNFVEANVRNYVAQLSNIFSNNAGLINTFLQPLLAPAYTNVNATMADKRQILKGILESLVAKEANFRTRLESQVEKLNAETTFVETLNLFFTNPTPTGWKRVYSSVGQRLNDRSLFGADVSAAWDVWDTKLGNLDDFDIAFDLASGTQLRSDLGTFLATNLQPKNFNYA